MTDTIRVTDETTVPEIEEALVHLVHAAKREIPKVGNDLLPTPWDRTHRRIDAVLDEWSAHQTVPA